MATDEEVESAIARVGAGGGNPRDIELTQKAARNAGQRGGKARRALQGRR